MSVAQLDWDKLIRVLGMIGSNHDGEVAAASHAADRLRHEAGATWRDIVEPVLLPPDRGQTVEDQISVALSYPDLLTEWEREFAASLAWQRKPLSEKQQTVLAQIVDKCRAAAGRTA